MTGLEPGMDLPLGACFLTERRFGRLGVLLAQLLLAEAGWPFELLADSRVLGALGSLGARDHATAELQKAIAHSHKHRGAPAWRPRSARDGWVALIGLIGFK